MRLMRSTISLKKTGPNPTLNTISTSWSTWKQNYKENWDCFTTLRRRATFWLIVFNWIKRWKVGGSLLLSAAIKSARCWQLLWNLRSQESTWRNSHYLRWNFGLRSSTRSWILEVIGCCLIIITAFSTEVVGRSFVGCTSLFLSVKKFSNKFC